MSAFVMRERQASLVFALFMGLAFLTVFRAAAVFFVPPLIVLLSVLHRAINIRGLVYLSLASFFLLLSILNSYKNFGALYLNWGVSLYWVVPITIFFALGKSGKLAIFDFHYVMKILSFFLLINSVFGFAQYSYYRYDDAFIGVFGRSGMSMHGLALIYGVFTIYYIAYRDVIGARTSLLFSALFFASMIFCFYGLGLFAFFSAFSLAVFFTGGGRLKKLSLAVCVVVLVLLVAYLITPNTVLYYLKNIHRVFSMFNDIEPGIVDAPARKLQVFVNYIYVYFRDFDLLLLGSGPGTFNSRASFFLNGDYGVPGFWGVSYIDLAQEYAFSLWNSDLLSRPYNDGTLNQPFSSFVSISAEYGIVFLLTYLLLLVNFFNLNFYSENPRLRTSEGVFSYYVFFLIVILLLLDNIVEYLDFYFLIILIVWLEKGQRSAVRE